MLDKRKLFLPLPIGSSSYLSSHSYAATVLLLTCFMSLQSPLPFSSYPGPLLEICEYNPLPLTLPPPVNDVIFGKISETPGYYWESASTLPLPSVGGAW